MFHSSCPESQADTIPALVRRSAERFGDAAAVVDGDVTLSFASLLAATREAARALIGLGVEPGDRVAIWAPNCWEWIVAALASTSVGAALVPVNTRYKAGEAVYVLEKSRARVLFTVTNFLDVDDVAQLRASGAMLPHLRDLVVLRGDAPAGTRSWSSFLAAGRFVSDEQADARAA